MGADPQGTEPAPIRRDHDRSMRRVGEALADRYREIGQAMAARILEEIPEYQHAAPELINDLRAGATATAEVNSAAKPAAMRPDCIVLPP